MLFTVIDEDGETIFEFQTVGATLETVLEELEEARARLGATIPQSQLEYEDKRVSVSLH